MTDNSPCRFCGQPISWKQIELRDRAAAPGETRQIRECYNPDCTWNTRKRRMASKP